MTTSSKDKSDESISSRIERTEPIARYVFFSDHYSLERKIVKAEAFMPNLKRNETDISIYRIVNCTEDLIWEIGQKYVAVPRKRPLYARGDITVNDVYDVSLEMEYAPGPHPRHANIIKFPSVKSEAKLKAMELAKRTKLVLNPHYS